MWHERFRDDPPFAAQIAGATSEDPELTLTETDSDLLAPEGIGWLAWNEFLRWDRYIRRALFRSRASRFRGGCGASQLIGVWWLSLAAPHRRGRRCGRLV